MQYEERTRIATPEGVELELVLAGLASRFIAELIDGVLILLLVGALVAVAALAGGTGGFVIFSVAVGGALLDLGRLPRRVRGARLAAARPASAGTGCAS